MITAEELQQVGIFECLEGPERQRLAQKAADVRLAPGDWLIREGETASFFVILEGRLAFNALLDRLDDIELDRAASELSHHPAFAHHGYRSIVLRFAAAESR